ncbi:MAG: hypothetical protein RL011_946, partial [Pseudomonadota bacterium]
NEADCIAKVSAELIRILGELTPKFEVLFVDDGSKDATFERITEMAKVDTRVNGIALSRNVGHMAALACGLDAARGDVVICMDADMQHPPELIPRMIDAWRSGYDVVNMMRRNTAETKAKGDVLSRLFYWTYNRTSDVQIIPHSPDFRLLDRRCVDALKSMPERLKFYRGMVPYIGFRQTLMEFECPPRFAGKRSYTLRKSLKLASDGIVSFSDVGLKLPLLVGGIISVLAIAYIIVSIVLVALGITPLAPGWVSLLSFNVLSLGLNLTFIGVFGLYLGKIFNEVKRRPLYFVQNSVGQPLPRRALTSHPDDWGQS